MCVDYYSGDIDPRGIVVVSGWHRHKIRIGFQAIDDTRKKKEKGKKIRVCHFGSLIWERPTYLQFHNGGIVSICYSFKSQLC